MFDMDKNNYNKNPKSSTIYTPHVISTWLHQIVSEVVQPKVLLDPAIGQGSLTNPWSDCYKIGVDIAADPDSHNYCDDYICGKFEEIENWEYPEPDLILCNPPFNGAPNRKLYPEVFLRQMVKLFGNKIPIMLFIPAGFRLNQKWKSKRLEWLNSIDLDISTIISLPLDAYGSNVIINSEILLFNIKGLKPHYFVLHQ